MDTRNKLIQIVRIITVCLIAGFLVSLLSAPIINPKQDSNNIVSNNETTESGLLFNYSPDLVPGYRARLVSYNDKVFTVRKVYGDTGLAKYRLVTETNKGTYKVYNVSESMVYINILEDKDAEPYADMQFSKDFSQPYYVEIYVPLKYSIESIHENDSISEDYNSKESVIR